MVHPRLCGWISDPAEAGKVGLSVRLDIIHPRFFVFAAYVHLSLGCSIYSDDDRRFLGLEEFIPKDSLSK